MYYPYFRGRQNELIVIRENAELLAKSGFVPIIEPVKMATNGLVRALDKVDDCGGRSVLIINPSIGDFRDRPSELEALFGQELATLKRLSVGVRIEPTSSLSVVASHCKKQAGRDIAIIHCGFPDGGKLARSLADCCRPSRHIFLDEHCGKLYRKHFKDAERILIRDGFKRRTNREYPPIEPFSDLHVTFEEEGMTGFGDFLMVGDDYQETGGPAYAVAIHLTYIDPDRDAEMFVFHFVSDRTDTNQDPAGKFGEALAKLVHEVQRSKTHIKKTRAVREFLDLHKEGHFPGLGSVKKLSMQHHIETLADFFASQGPQGR